LESFQDPEREVARAIRDSESSRSSKDTMKSMVDRMGKRNCPACRELISRKAMKCPRCRHVIRRFRVDA
jgi:ssDNA-binding Zn-finger/Zn-ribbon topoisomerase 1